MRNMTEHLRIATNGLVFRIQWYGKKRLLGQNKWHWLYRKHPDGDYIPEFYNKEEAQDALKKAREQFETEKRGWRPI